MTSFLYQVRNLKSLGVKQSWKNVTSSRGNNVTYSNNSSSAIAVSILCSRGTDFNVYLYVNNIIVDRITKEREGYWRTTLQAIIPPGATYKFSQIGNSTIEQWLELS